MGLTKSSGAPSPLRGTPEEPHGLRERYVCVIARMFFAALVVAAPIAAAAASPVPYVPVPKGGAVILNTGSTNTLGYRISVGQDGSANYVQPGGAVKSGQLPAAVAKNFWSDVRAAMPLSKLHRQMCMKSVSFGVSIYVWWHGERSGDVSCGGSLASDAEAVANALGIKTMQGRLIPLMPNEPRRVMPTPTPTTSP